MGMTHALNILKNENLDLAAIIDRNPDAIEKGLNPGRGNLQPLQCLPESSLGSIKVCYKHIQ